MIAILANVLLAQTPVDDQAGLHERLDAVGPETADPGWLIFGLAAQAVIIICLVVHMIASRRRGRFVIPLAVGYLGTIATLMLLVYAARQHYAVFVVGQFVNTLICLRLLVLIRRAQQRIGPEEDSRFPVVAPDSAERKIPPSED